MNEFELIRRYFTQNSSNVVLGVGDDAAIVEPTPGNELLVSTDMLVEGRHFFADIDPVALGHKTLAVNLSDMAAMGAKPRWAFLSLALPKVDERWLTGFTYGFFELAKRYEVSLAGGDTTSGPLTLCVTILGESPLGSSLRRQGAQPGDDIWVSGVIGMAALAVRQQRNNTMAVPAEVLAVCKAKLDFPEPRIELGIALRRVASAVVDVSDGLVADLGHILDCSRVAAVIDVNAIPTHDWLATQRYQCLDTLVAGGDDYELCFTAPKQYREDIATLSRQLTCQLTHIGCIEEGLGLRLKGEGDEEIPIRRAGFDHFSH